MELISGSTLISVLLERNRFLTIINVGDSRAVACDTGGRAIPLSADHKPSDVSLLSTSDAFVHLLSILCIHFTVNYSSHLLQSWTVTSLLIAFFPKHTFLIHSKIKRNQNFRLLLIRKFFFIFFWQYYGVGHDLVLKASTNCPSLSISLRREQISK